MYEVITWPEIQNYMDKEGFEENAYLVNDEQGIEDFGSSAYFVDVDWLNEVDEKFKSLSENDKGVIADLQA